MPNLAYYSNVIIRDGSGTPAMWHISITGYVEIALLLLLVTARDGAVGVPCADFQLVGHGQDMLVLQVSGVSRNVGYIGLVENICGCGFDPVASSIAYNPSSQVDWAWVDKAQCHCTTCDRG